MMFKMMLNAADRMVDKLKLRLSEKDRQIHDLQEEVKHLKQVIVDARMTESRLVSTMEEGNQKWNSVCVRWRQRAEEAEFRVQQLENCASKHLYDSVREKLLTVSSKLSDDDITVIGEVRMTKFDGILAIGRMLRAKALHVQSHPGDYTGFAYYPSLKDFKAMLKFSGKNYDDWVQEVKVQEVKI